MGTFFAPETYFAPQEFSLQAAHEQVESGVLLGRIGYLLVLLWLIPQYARAPGAMLSASLRSIVPILLAVWMIASASWSVDPGGSFNRSGRALILVLFAIYLAERYDSEQLVRIVTIAGALAVLASFIAVIALPSYAYTTLNGYEGAWRGAAIHKNSLGALMTVLFAFGYYARHAKCSNAFINATVLFGSPFLVFMSRSATSLLVLGVTFAAIAVIGFLNALKYQSEKTFVATLIAGATGCCYLLYSHLDSLLLMLGRDPSLTGRTEVWQRVEALIAERPWLGYGHGFWGIDSLQRDGIWAELGWAAPHAHNTFLDIRLQLGLVGVVIASCLFSIVLFRAARLILLGMPSVALVWPLIVLTTLFRGLTETYLVDPGTSGLFWCALAFAAMSRLAVESRSAPTHPFEAPLSRIQRPFAARHAPTPLNDFRA